jgi:hypothetical protein
MVSQIVSKSWRMPRTNYERPFHDFVIQHKEAARTAWACSVSCAPRYDSEENQADNVSLKA